MKLHYCAVDPCLEGGLNLRASGKQRARLYLCFDNRDRASAHLHIRHI